MRKSIFFTALMLAGISGLALADDLEGETPAVKTADRLEWAWDGGDRLSVAVPGTVHYQQSGTPRVIVRGPSDLLARVRFDHGQLGLERSVFGWDSNGEKLDVTITGTLLHRIGVAGSGDVELGELKQDRLTLAIAGSGSISASGKVDDLSLHVAGSGDGHLEKLTSNNLDVRIAGSGKLDAGAAQHADVAISGSGQLHFGAAMPEDINVHVSGSGAVTDANGRLIGGRYQAGRKRDRETR